MEGMESTNKASMWAFAVVALLIGGFVGYWLGSSGTGAGLVNNGGQEEVSVVEEIAGDTEAPTNPFDEAGGYTNPFEEVKVNPFAQ